MSIGPLSIAQPLVEGSYYAHYLPRRDTTRVPGCHILYVRDHPYDSVSRNFRVRVTVSQLKPDGKALFASLFIPDKNPAVTQSVSNHAVIQSLNGRLQ